MPHPLTPANYDGVVAALTGNGELCTTLSPTGYHVAPKQATDEAHRTQQFAWAGRRRRGPRHPLVNFGSVWRALRVDGEPCTPRDWSQEVEPEQGAVVSTWRYDWGEEKTRSLVSLADNLFLADTVLVNTSGAERELRFTVAYRFGEPDADLRITGEHGEMRVAYRLEDHLGDLLFGSTASVAEGEGVEAVEHTTRALPDGAEGTTAARLAPGEALVVTTWLHFSDRLHYGFSITAKELDAAVERHERAWSDFWARSEVVTGDALVDEFRRMALYTLRCQATPWSIPPTLSERYWGGGAFHDELYSFFGLLSANYADVAERIPYFRLTTLPQARQRARGRGALYPWSSTEYGEERDPNGLWLTERFHMGQFAACIRALWLANRDPVQLDDLYPVLRDIARYYETEVVEKTTDDERRMTDGGGASVGTRACVDFDESVGAVRNGPFTVSAAIASLEYAAGAADVLARDAERAARWRALAAELRGLLPELAAAMPSGKPLHISILGQVFPFRLGAGEHGLREAAARIHEAFRTMRGWKSGDSDVFAGSAWTWTAGHLGAVHALLGDAERAWEAVRRGPLSAGPFLSPNEHVTADDIIRVPWFTTGCGAWLYALHALFVQMDEEGTRLLPAVPDELPGARFRDLLADRGVLVSGAFRGGALAALTARAPRPLTWRFRLPVRYAPLLRRNVETGSDGWAVFEVPVGPEPLSLLR